MGQARDANLGVISTEVTFKAVSVGENAGKRGVRGLRISKEDWKKDSSGIRLNECGVPEARWRRSNLLCSLLQQVQ